MVAELQDARVRGIGRIENALFVQTKAQHAGKMTLSGAPPGLEKGSVREKDEDVALLRVSHINGAAGVHRDPRRTMQAWILERKQGSAIRFKFVDKSGARVREENAAPRIRRKRHRGVEFARALAWISPGAEEFKRRGRLRFRSRIRAISARNEEKYGNQRGLRKSPMHRIGIYIRHAANLRSEIVRTFRIRIIPRAFRSAILLARNVLRRISTPFRRAVGECRRTTG